MRQLIYGLILTVDTGLAKTSSTAITEYDRKRADVAKTTLKSMWDMSGHDQYPSWVVLATQEPDEQRQFFLHLLGIKDAAHAQLASLLPPGLLLACLVIIYWINHAEPVVTSNHVRAVLVCMLKLYLLDRPKACLEWASLTGITEEDAVDVERKLNRYKKSEYFSKNNKMDTSIVHGFAQYQSCLHYGQILNQLCMSPFDRPNPAVLLNGSLLYNVCKELNQRSDPSQYVHQMLEQDSTVQLYFARLWDVITTYANLQTTRDVSGDKKRRKRNRKSKAVRHSCSASEPEDNRSKSRDRAVVVAACSINNKFQGLGME